MLSAQEKFSDAHSLECQECPMKRRTYASLVCACLLVTASPVLAADCDVNVFNAYLTAMARGWQFRCRHNSTIQYPFFTPKFATYPPSTIGCSTKTSVQVPSLPRVTGELFEKSGGLKNGWSLKAYEVMGDQWWGSPAGNAQVRFLHEASALNTSYNVKIKRMTLTKSGGVCANAIDEAF
jgi:hypothetical protein